MIIPIHGLNYCNFTTPIIGDEIHLSKYDDNNFDSMAIAAYDKHNHQIGYVSAQNDYNKKVFSLLSTSSTKATVWGVSKIKF